MPLWIFQIKTASSSVLITTFPLQLWNTLHSLSLIHIINLLPSRGCGWGTKLHAKSCISTFSIINDIPLIPSPHACAIVCFCAHVAYPTPLQLPPGCLWMQQSSYHSEGLLVDCQAQREPCSPGSQQLWLTATARSLQRVCG